MIRKGIVLAGGTGSRLFPLTMAVSKQLMPVFDKPMIYYPLSVLMLAGIRDILIITTPEDAPQFQRLLGDGSDYGVHFRYATQPEPEGLPQAFLIGEACGFLRDEGCALVLGDNLFYGHDLVNALRTAAAHRSGATIFAYPVNDPSAYGVVEFDERGRVLSLEEKPATPRSRFAVPGVYFYDARVVELARTLKPSSRGELEITDLIRLYLDRDALRAEPLGRGTAWLDTGTPTSLLQASQFVEVIQSRQGLLIACLEEIAWNQGWIDQPVLQRRIERLGQSDYARYLKRLLSGSQPSTS
jgi:glucose-1-phosphate thymidylyltransferase